jgi:hypothetical protein
VLASPLSLIVLSLLVCNYNELVEWPGGHLLGCLFTCGICQIMANRYEGVILLMSLAVKDGSFVREEWPLVKGP